MRVYATSFSAEFTAYSNLPFFLLSSAVSVTNCEISFFCCSISLCAANSDSLNLIIRDIGLWSSWSTSLISGSSFCTMGSLLKCSSSLRSNSSSSSSDYSSNSVRAALKLIRASEGEECSASSLFWSAKCIDSVRPTWCLGTLSSAPR